MGVNAAPGRRVRRWPTVRSTAGYGRNGDRAELLQAARPRKRARGAAPSMFHVEQRGHDHMTTGPQQRPDEDATCDLPGHVGRWALRARGVFHVKHGQPIGRQAPPSPNGADRSTPHMRDRTGSPSQRTHRYADDRFRPDARIEGPPSMPASISEESPLSWPRLSLVPGCAGYM